MQKVLKRKKIAKYVHMELFFVLDYSELHIKKLILEKS